MINFVALMLALLLEKLFVQFAHLRNLPALDAYGRFVVHKVRACRPERQLLLAACYALAPAVGIAVLAVVADLHNVSYVAYAALTLAFALGPQDLFAQTQEYIALVRAASPLAASRAAELLEHDAGQRTGEGFDRVADVVFVQANNRVFGVLFWFTVLGVGGPAGAVLFRVTDVLRRTAIREAAAHHDAAGDAVIAVLQRVHGALAWAPARLLALCFGVAGSFDDAFRGWRGYLSAEGDEFFEANDLLLVHAGQGALSAAFASSTDEAGRTELALTLVRRSLYVWIAALALLAALVP